MPPPSTPRRASARKKQTPPKRKVDVGSPLGPYDNNTVRERIRTWQSQGGGVITASDIFVESQEEPDPTPEKSAEKTIPDKPAVEKPTPKKNREEPTGLGDSETPRRRSGRRKDKEDEPPKSKHRSISAPRKRIVSDGHWVKKRSTPRTREKVVPGKQSPPTWTLPDDGIRVHAVDDGSERTPKERETPLQSRNASSYYDDGIRVYSTPPSSRKPSEFLMTGARDADRLSVQEDLSGDTASLGSSIQRSREATPEKSPNSAKNTSSGSRKGSKRKSQHQAKEKTANTSPRVTQEGFAAKKDTRKASKGNIFSNVVSGSKKIFAKSEPVPIPAPRVPNIESWLNDTPDPFLDDNHAVYVETAAAPPETVVAESIIHGHDNQSFAEVTEDGNNEEEEPPVEVPAPLKPSSRRRKRTSTGTARTEEAKTADPNGIWDAFERKESSSSKRREERRRRRESSMRAPAEEPIRAPAELSNEYQPDHRPEKESSPTVIAEIEISKPDLSPSSLRRRGATRRDGTSSTSPTRERRKSSPLKDSFTPAETEHGDVAMESVVSSAHTGSSVETSEPIPPLRPTGLNARRPFPSVGKHKLSTIASVETLESKSGRSELNDAPDSQNEATPNFRDKAPPSGMENGHKANVLRKTKPTTHSARSSHSLPSRTTSELKRRRTKNRIIKHDDLMSVLSLPASESKRSRSTRSTRTALVKPEVPSLSEILDKLAADESKYMRELKTLVDGVIPVLLSSVLSKNDSSVAAGLFSANASTRKDQDLTQPIYNIGITLERLKRAHKRIPVANTKAFLTWAHGTTSVYKDYLKAWRMGFSEVVVNLAPAENAKADANFNDDMPRDENGDVIGDDGERVDVAFLLKRPLKRVKDLAKTIANITQAEPSAEAEKLAKEFEELTTYARQRVSEEDARLEDEAASCIDATKARDLKTMGPLQGVAIDSTRRVHARDSFNLTLLHSTCMLLDCRVEVVLRYDADGGEYGGDVLICEVDEKSRWLLFPPIHRGKISARPGDSHGELVVMVRGMHSNGQEWHELLSLHTEDITTIMDFAQWLGATPIPPSINRTQSFIGRAERRKTLSLPVPPSGLTELVGHTTPMKSRTPSPRELQIPIGETAHGGVKKWVDSPVRALPAPPIFSSPATLPQRPVSQPQTPIATTSDVSSAHSDGRASLPSQRSLRIDSSLSAQAPCQQNDRASSSPTSGLRRTKAKRYSKHVDDQASKSSAASPEFETLPLAYDQPSYQAKSQVEIRTSPLVSPVKAERPAHHRSKSSTPSLDLPIIPKLRKDSPTTTPVKEREEEPVWPKEEPARSPRKLTKKRPEVQEDRPPPPPPLHRSPSPVQVGNTQTPDLASGGANKGHRRTSSPLKHEYAPSSESSVTEDSETSTVEHNDLSSTSDSSESDSDSEFDYDYTPSATVLSLHKKTSVAPIVPATPVISVPKEDSIAPSQSASQAPYRQVPAQSPHVLTAVASISRWVTQGVVGRFEPLHDADCTIVIRDGIIEAYDMHEFHSKSSQSETSPLSGHISLSSPPRVLLAQELTPMVQLSKPDALNVSIRSPPVPGSHVEIPKDGSMPIIYYRSSTMEGCARLYNMINYARMHNPTYLEMERARLVSEPQFGGASFNPRPASRSGSLWRFGLGRSSSYRASEKRAPSTHQSETSMGSRVSQLSAFKWLSGISGTTKFSIARSTVTSRQGSSVYTTSNSNSSGSGTSTPNPAAMLDGRAAVGNLSNVPISFFKWVDKNDWQRQGGAFLTALRPEDPMPRFLSQRPGGLEAIAEVDSTLGELPQEPVQLPVAPDARRVINGKRIIIMGKKGHRLLDVILGQDSFTLTQARGIAVEVWESKEGGAIVKEGGVLTGKSTKYLFMFNQQHEARNVYNMLGNSSRLAQNQNGE